MSEAKNTGDTRLAKTANQDPAAQDRDLADAARTGEDGTTFTKEERMAMIRAEWQQDVLPMPPRVPGWHYCWLSTTNSTDPIYKRMQHGYEPVKASEIPGFAQYRATSGQFEGCVACNEMLLFKIEEDLYQEIMKVFHFEKPLQEEQILKANLPSEDADEDSNGRKLVTKEGFETLARKVRSPSFYD